MTNKNKQTGNEGEREAVRAIIRLAADLVVTKPMRMLGAGRKDDEGDLRVLPDAAVQVKAYKASGLSQAITQAAAGAARQAVNAQMPYGVGLVRVPGAKRDGSQVRWVAVAYDWPVPLTPFVHTSGLDAFRWVAAQQVDRDDVVIRVARSGMKPVLLGSLFAWLCSYRLVASAGSAAVSEAA